jgi:hypothetical protein
MLDSFLDVAYAHEAREQMERDAIALLKQLPAEDLLKIASGHKVAWLEPKACGPDGASSFLERFRGTPLFDEAMALEQEELQAEMTNLERRKEQRATSQMEQGLWDLQDQLRIKKRLLELRLAAQDAGMGAQAGGGATPPLNSPMAPEASAQGAGAPGAESAPVEANKTAARKEKTFADEPSSGRGRAFLQTVGDAAQGGALGGAGVGGVLGAIHGSGKGSSLKERVLNAIGHGAMGMGGGALAGGALLGGQAIPGAGVGSMTASPLIGAAGGAGAGYLLSKALPHGTGEVMAPAATALGGATGLIAGLRARDTHRQNEQFHKERAGLDKAAALSTEADAWGRELARADFAKAAEAVALEEAATEAGAVLAKEGAGLPGGLGALGTMATNFIKNPANARTVLGAGAGALGGLASGLQKDEHGQRHLLGGLAKGVAGGALGGLAGHAVQNIGTSLSTGTGLAPAVKQYGAGWAQKIRDVAGSMRPAIPAAPRAVTTPLQAAA